MLAGATITQAAIIGAQFGQAQWDGSDPTIVVSAVPTGTVNSRGVSSRTIEQTFTVGVTGFTLDKIWAYLTSTTSGQGYEIRLFSVADPDAASISAGTNLFPSAQTGTVSATTSNGYAIFDVANVPLAANTSYAIQFLRQGTDNPFNLGRYQNNLLGTSGAYYENLAITNSGANGLRFAVQSVIPEPGTLALAALGGLLALPRRRVMA